MSGVPRVVRAPERFAALFPGGELDRLVGRAYAAAERSPGWAPGAEYVFELEDPPHAVPGVELSAFIGRHAGGVYEVLFYDAPTGETYQ